MERQVRPLVGMIALLIVLGTSIVRADNPADASYREGEAQRQDLIARQLDLNHRMIWQRGFGPRWPDPFEPWPRVPGDLRGYPGPRPVEHPVGHRSEQVGPDHWIYRPVYASEAMQTSSRPLIAPRPSVPALRPLSPEPPRPSNTQEPPAKASGENVPKRSAGPRAF
jgi:hypothetical protein